MDNPQSPTYSNEIWQKTKAYGVPAFIAGAGFSGLVAALAEMRRQRELSQEPAKRKDVLEIQQPAPKVAGIGSGLFDIIRRNYKTTAAAIGVGAGLGGYGANYVAHSPVAPDALDYIKEKAPSLAPVAAKILTGPPPADNKIPDSTFLGDAITAGVVGAGALGGYTLIDAIIKNRRAAAAADRRDKAQKEYSQLLGESLTGPSSLKTASFPLCEETVRLISGMVAARANIPVIGETKIAGFQEVLGHIPKLPALIALASAVAAHQFMYNREKQVEETLTRKRVSPPKEIRLVSAPAAPAAPVPQLTASHHLSLPAPAVDDADKEDDDKKVIDPSIDKSAELAEAGILGGLLLGGAPERKLKPPVPGDVNGDGKFDPIKPVVEKVDASTYRITTPAGAVTIDATDPNTRHILERDHSRLAELLTSVSAIPQEEKVASVSTWRNIVAWDAKYYSGKAA